MIIKCLERIVMSRKVFFSFHFQRDAWRAGQVRNSGMLANEDEYGVIDSVEWEEIERAGDEAIRRWIDGQLKYTSVTVVLIGAETAERDWVDYEIRKSWERGNALVGLRVHNVKDQHSKTDTAGPNPLDHILLADGTPLSTVCNTFDWVTDDGRSNLDQWVEDAYQARATYDGETELGETAMAALATSVQEMNVAGPTIIRNPPKQWGF
jgi:MTH538 TIR-like domain (DUF1863)